MRRTLLYVIILALLGFSIYYFIFRGSSSPYDPAEAGFTVKDTASIGKLFLAANDGESITVERTDSGWIVNKQYKALPSSLNLVMTTLNQQAALYPVTKGAYENVVKELSTDGVKVEVYDRAGKKMRVFYVGGAAINNSGTNMMMDKAGTPYVVQIQGFTGYLTPRFSTKLRDWRDRTVFNIPADEIKSVSVQYAANPLDGFNARRAGVYLKYFTNINCEGYLNGLQDMDTTIRSAPRQSSIDVTGIHGQHQHVDIYWMALNKRSKNRTVSNPDVPDDYDSDRLYAIINNSKDTVLIQQFIFRNIFHKAFEFYQKDDAPATDEHKPRPKNLIYQKNQ